MQSDSWPPSGFQFLWDEREAVALRPVIFHPVCRACAQTSPDSTLTSIYSLCCPGYSVQSGDHVPCWRRKRPLNGSAVFALLSFNRIFSRPGLAFPSCSCLKPCVCFESSFWGPPVTFLEGLPHRPLPRGSVLSLILMRVSFYQRTSSQSKFGFCTDCYEPCLNLQFHN